MARITVEDCLEHVPNRFNLTLLAASRARDLATGAAEPLLDWENDKPTVMALREIATGVTEFKTRREVEAEEELSLDMTIDPSVTNDISGNFNETE